MDNEMGEMSFKGQTLDFRFTKNGLAGQHDITLAALQIERLRQVLREKTTRWWRCPYYEIDDSGLGYERRP